jgi:hypothetical protein
LSGTTTPLVGIGTFVITAGGLLTITSFVDGTLSDTELVVAVGFDELLLQPLHAMVAVPNAAITRYFLVFMCLSLPFFRATDSNQRTSQSELAQCVPAKTRHCCPRMEAF